jgi:hypothetical protein
MRKENITRFLCALIAGIVLTITPNNAPAHAATGSFSTALTITSAGSLVLSFDTVRVVWGTSDNASSQVFYDTQPHADISQYAFHNTLDNSPVLQHSVTLGGLRGGTMYHFRISSTVSFNGSLFTTISNDLTFQTLADNQSPSQVTPPPVEPGGTRPVDVGQFIGSAPLVLDPNGVTQTPVWLSTKDGRVLVTINAGTRMLDAYGLPIRSLSVDVPAGTVPPSTDAVISIWDFRPNGTTFVPPIALTLSYDFRTIADGIQENSLYIAFWDGVRWRRLVSTVNTLAETVTALCPHFTLFAVMGEKPAVVLPPVSPNGTKPIIIPPPVTPNATIPAGTLLPPTPNGTYPVVNPPPVTVNGTYPVDIPPPTTANGTNPIITLPLVIPNETNPAPSGEITTSRLPFLWGMIPVLLVVVTILIVLWIVQANRKK